jgi:hypothetical protein
MVEKSIRNFVCCDLFRTMEFSWSLSLALALAFASTGRLDDGVLVTEHDYVG